MHNKCRGLAAWPGLWSTFQVVTGDAAGSAAAVTATDADADEAWRDVEAQRIKIITTTVLDDEADSDRRTQAVTVVKQVRLLCCMSTLFL